MLRVSFFFGGGRSVTSPASFFRQTHLHVFFEPKKYAKRWIFEEEEPTTGVYGNLWICLWLRHPSLILWWFYLNFSLLDILLCFFFSNACGAGGASAGGVVGAWSYPQKISGPTHETGSFLGGRLLFGGVPAESWCLGLGTFWYIRHFDISSISCSETDGVTHFLFQKATFWDGESADCIRQYLRKGLRSSIKKEASSCFVRTTGCWRDAYCSSEAWLDMLDVWTLHVLSQQDCIYKVTIGYLSCL